MPQALNGRTIAILASDGFEQQELAVSKTALEAAGARVEIVSLKKGRILGWDVDSWGEEIRVDVALDHTSAHRYDGLMLPGGMNNPDHLRMSQPALHFIRDFFAENKPVAAICHAPAVLVDAGVLPGHTLTSFPAIRTDILNAGGHWVDRPVVSDRGLITSRSPDDLPDFVRTMISAFADARHDRGRDPARAAPPQWRRA